VKSIASSTDLPDEIRAGVPKPELPEDEKAALHNVTSGLYNRAPVKQSVDRAIEDVCKILNVPPPSKGKPSRPRKQEDGSEPEDRTVSTAAKNDESASPEEGGSEAEDVTDFEGFESDVDEPGPVIGDVDSAAEEEEEKEFSKYDDLLGSSSDDEGDDAFGGDVYAKFRGREKVNLDDISVSGSDHDDEGEDDSESDEDKEQEGRSTARAPSLSQSPEPKKPKEKKQSKAATGPTTSSTFLPSLMGGYISGSESASDVDIAPPKKRRGQRARQAIWEKKFGGKAKHLQKSSKQQGGRDAGWDMRRGAVDGDDQGGRMPWKRGVSNPFDKRFGDAKQAPPPPPRKKDNEGTLHPSWEARKKAKDSQKTATFTGQKVVFD
jgi:hypothetical protein